MIVLALACSPSDRSPVPIGLPDRAPARVLTAQLAPEGVSVHGVTPGSTWMDLDDPADERFGFQYRVESSDGEVLFERSIVGPTVVESFLSYWSEQSGIDILTAFPTLGWFPLPVPELDGAAIVRFRVRDAAGQFVDRGIFDLARLDDPAFEIPPADFVVGHELLRGSGLRPENQLDLAIVGDGFLEEELPAFRLAALEITQAFLAQEPYASFPNAVNVWRVDAVSESSGVGYDCLDGCGPLDTAFDSIYAIEAVNALMGTTYDTRAIFQADQWAVAQAVSVVPWDAVLVIANTPRFGGMAIHYATTTLDPSYPEIATHELGHSIGFLGDEYTGDFCVRSESLGLPENIADDPSDVPWAHWIDDDTPLPTPDDGTFDDRIGAFGPAYNCDDLYRPSAHCQMNDYGPFCPVCAELVSRRLFRFVDPADSIELFAEGNTWEVLASSANLDWPVTVRVDGAVVAEGQTSSLIPFDRPDDDAQELTVEVRVETPLVREDHGDLTQIRRWSL
jgi:hypothetical protein